MEQGETATEDEAGEAGLLACASTNAGKQPNRKAVIRQAFVSPRNGLRNSVIIFSVKMDLYDPPRAAGLPLLP